MNRRAFITGLTSLIAAPAIVPYARLMPVRNILRPTGVYTLPIFDALAGVIYEVLRVSPHESYIIAKHRVSAEFVWCRGNSIQGLNIA